MTEGQAEAQTEAVVSALRPLAQATFLDTSDGLAELRRFGRRWKDRTWAIEGCNGVGKHLSSACSRPANDSSISR
jgi:transposase